MLERRSSSSVDPPVNPAPTTEDWDLLIEGAVKAGVFGGKSDALREFAREYFEDHENERITAAITLYKRERITLGEAARLADVDRWTMRDVLREHRVDPRLGLADAAYESQAANEDQGVTVVGSVGVSLAVIDAGRIAESASDEWLSTWIDEIGYYVPYRNVSEYR